MAWVRVEVVAYQPRPGIPLEEYPDYPIGREFRLDEIDRMTDEGVLTPGLVLRGKCAGKVSPLMVVRGNYGTVQTVERL